MQLRHTRTVHQAPEQRIQKIGAIAYSPNSLRLAIADAYRVVHLYDETLTKRDKFATKPASSKGAKTYAVRAMAFSPDSTKLAIAQSDNIVFVYKLGADWGDSKSICNKFLQQSPVTAMCWPTNRPNELVYGCLDGGVRVGHIRTNRPASLYTIESEVVALAATPDGTSVLSSHVDGSVWRFFFDDGHSGGGQTKLIILQAIPYALTCTNEQVIVGASDCTVRMLEINRGHEKEKFEYEASGEEGDREFTVAAVHPGGGDTVVVGSYNRLRVYNYNRRRDRWEEAPSKRIPNLYSVTALTWKPDGSKLFVGSLCGFVDCFEACLKRVMYGGGKFELLYVSRSQVIVNQLSTGQKVQLTSHLGYEIEHVDLYEDRYVIANTTETLLVGDMEECRMSEVPWPAGVKPQRCFFDHDRICMVLHAGELSFIEYGRNEILGSCRTEYVSSHLLSVRLLEPPASAQSSDETQLQHQQHATHGIGFGNTDSEGLKRVAYLMDRQTITITDLVSGISLSTVHHDTKIDWLELNERATKLLFRDKRAHLHLYDVATQQRTTLLTFCSYVQWVPSSDVIVAQQRQDLCIWYNIDAPDRATIVPVRGDVVEIERSEGQTRVIIEDGSVQTSIDLNNALIDFGAAIDTGDSSKAIRLLEGMAWSPEVEAMWVQLAQWSMKQQRLDVAERAYAALGDVSRARYLHKTNVLSRRVAEEMGGGDGTTHFGVRARLRILERQFKEAEQIYLKQGQVEVAMAMYAQLHRHFECIEVAEARNHPEAQKLRVQYYEWLIDSQQYARAGELKEDEREYMEAMQLYLRGGMPSRAAQVVMHQRLGIDRSTMEDIISALQRCGMDEKAGEFLESQGESERALECYRAGKCFRKAVELARSIQPALVTSLEREWGDFLLSHRQLDAALNHYVESGDYQRAIETAIAGRQWTKAVQYVERQDPQRARPWLLKIAEHFEETRKAAEAERFYVRAGEPRRAVDMYTRSGALDAAHRVASEHLSKHEAVQLYMDQAQRLETQGKLAPAEKLYLRAGELPRALHMYESLRRYDDVIRLVSQYKKGELESVHKRLAAQFEEEANHRQAEHHYVQGHDWQAAVTMYRHQNLWDDAMRVAKVHGGAEAGKHVAFAWAMHCGGEEGAQLLRKFGLVEKAIEYAVESGNFDQALELANSTSAGKSHISDIHIKHAMALEDEGRFGEAEEAFLQGGKPREAVDMYIHQRDWANAQRIAESHDQSAITDIILAKAQIAADEQNNLRRAEDLYIQAKRPDLAIQMYRQRGVSDDALRIAEQYAPHLVYDIQTEMYGGVQRSQEIPQQKMQPGDASASPEERLTLGRQCESTGEFTAAIDWYLSVSVGDAVPGMGAEEQADYLEEIWESAVRLAMNHVQPRISAVVGEVAGRLTSIGRLEAAAELYIGIDQYKQAVDVYISAGEFDKAMSICQSMAPQLVGYVQERMGGRGEIDSVRQSTSSIGGAGVEDSYAQSIAQKAAVAASTQNLQKDAGSRPSGDSMEAAAQRGDWDSCLSIALREGPISQKKYAVYHADALVRQHRFSEAANILSQHGCATPAELSTGEAAVYRCALAPQRLLEAVAMHLLRDPESSEKSVEEMFRVLRDVSGNEEFRQAVRSLLDMVHIVRMKQKLWKEAKGNGKTTLVKTAAKAAVAAVRYTDTIPCDKTYYEAGIAAKEAKWFDVAFVLWNRYLDIIDCIEDGDSHMELDTTDFVVTDLPSEIDLPPNYVHAVEEDDREDVREWILTHSLEQSFGQSLPTQSCERCGTDMFDGSQKCPQCSHERSLCIVTGYPISRLSMVQCKHCQKTANRDDWVQYIKDVKAVCPWCDNAVNLQDYA